MKNDAIDRWISHTKAGTLEAHLWQHPDDMIQVYCMFCEDAGRGGDLTQVIGRGVLQLRISATKTKRRLWRNWDLSHIAPDARLETVALLQAATLDQAEFNFITAADIGTAWGVRRTGNLAQPLADGKSISLDEFGQAIHSAYAIAPENRRLATGFSRQMVNEAEAHRHQVALGTFEMERVPLQYIDSLFTYDSIRLIIRPDGIAASFIGTHEGETHRHPFWWTPEGHTCWMLGGNEAFAVNVLMSCIWRDACIVRHRMLQERSRTIGNQRGKSQHQRSKLLLPRVINHCAWSLDSERERIIHSQHSVRAFFRTLPDGHQASEAATHQAQQYGYPLPPEGFTFVRPHQRGGEEVAGTAQPTPIVCTGLQTAAIALNWQGD